MDVLLWLCSYYAVGLAFHLFVPKPTKAAEAFGHAERSHPLGFVLVAFLVATFWPICLVGTLRRLFRKSP